ncbi:MAG: nuclear transport factor 2 family protein [Bacteroidetes bacterium]|nr:nuclear transport factor 2 family protein [Bacteroidota bacterium]
MKNSIKVWLFLCVLISIISSGFAQQWSAEQKEVWAGVEKYWDAYSNGDAQGFLNYMDDSYIGWSYQSKVPQNKTNTGQWIVNDFKKNSTILYTLSPLSIWVKDDFAFVHYFYSQLEKNNKTGEEDPSSGKWTDILMKKNGKWVLIGDHGGRISKQSKVFE